MDDFSVILEAMLGHEHVKELLVRECVIFPRNLG